MRRARRMSPGSLEVVSPREAASPPPATIAFERISRLSGESHIVSVDQATMQPIGCSCLAGQRRLLCWAVLDVMGLEMASGSYGVPALPTTWCHRDRYTSHRRENIQQVPSRLGPARAGY